ncbi:MAG: AI-2E family transporter [Saprospiraceae bacterium]
MLKGTSARVVSFPFYAKTAFILIGIFVFLTMLFIGKSIIIPLLFGFIFSILFTTVVEFLVKRKFSRLLAIIITVFSAVALGVIVAIWLGSRANLLIDALPLLQQKFDQLQAQVVPWITEHLGIKGSKLNGWINDARHDLMDLSAQKIGTTLKTVMNASVILFLLPVYIFLMLYYQPIMLDFIHRVVGKEHERNLGSVLVQMQSILKGYFAGLLIELVIVAVLNSIGLLALGIQFAILIGILGAVLNMIPYIGGMIQLLISMTVALLTKDDPMYAVYVALVFFVIQIIDNNFLMPKIVGSKVRINALVAIVVVIAGGAFWGIAGMFLAIPITAILKVIFDHIEELKPWGLLLGDTMPPMVKIKLPRKKKPVPEPS